MGKNKTISIFIVMIIVASVVSFVAGVTISRRSVISNVTELFYEKQVSSEVFYYGKFFGIAEAIDELQYGRARCIAVESGRHIFHVLRQCADDESCRRNSGMIHDAPELIDKNLPGIMNDKNCR
jgi:hypothetical protein